MRALPAWLRALWPAPLAIDRSERLRVVVGAALGVLLTALLSQAFGGAAATAWLVAPMGATTVLVFAVPSSPMAQPWAVIGGNVVSALVGIACARWVGPVSGAIAAMLALRCLHPPGGACALLTALTGVTDPTFALFPVLVNSLLLMAAALAYHRATRQAHPQTLPAAQARAAPESAIDADLDAVIARYNQVLDIHREDLKALLEDTRLQGYQRKLVDIRCSDIMSRQLVTVHATTALAAAQALMRQHRVKALPVVDSAGGIAGIVTTADFVRAAATVESVGQIMTRKVRVASADRHLAELIPLFGSSGHHHLPIVDAAGRLVGIVTQSDVVAALCRPTSPAS